MSSEFVSSVVDLHRTDAAEVCRVLRPYLVAGGVASVVIDFGERKLYLERTAEAHKQAVVLKQQRELSDSVDPVPIVMENELIELNVEGMSIKEVMFECVHLAAKYGAAVSHWACGNAKFFAELGGFERPLMSQEFLVAGSRVVESSEYLRPGDLVACLSPSQDALAMEVERGLLIRLEDLRNVEADQYPDRVRSYPEGSIDVDEVAGVDHGEAGPPTWFGPAPS